MFQALVKTLLLAVEILSIPSLTTLVMVYDPSHGGESL
jgi:hypothetical protein